MLLKRYAVSLKEVRNPTPVPADILRQAGCNCSLLPRHDANVGTAEERVSVDAHSGITEATNGLPAGR
jgi:hypothetical protein